jgi:aromatic-L-amino-acid decarboxylase
VAGLGVRPAVYLSEEGHHSLVKAARMAGLGTDALRTVPMTERRTLDPAALDAQIEADRRAGWYPLMVIATAGTTSSGATDPLGSVAEVASAWGAWFHVDAAWGGLAALVPRLRPLLAGLERADSVSWDAHKGLSVPMGAGMFFCRHPDAAARAFAATTSYMPPSSGPKTVDPYASTTQWSRRAIGLKVFLALAELGVGGYETLLEQQVRMADLLRSELRSRGWRVVNDSELPVVCFTHPEIRAGRLTTSDVLGEVYDRRRVWLSDVVLDRGERVLRACITSFASDVSDVGCLIDELEIALRRAARRRLAGH